MYSLWKGFTKVFIEQINCKYLIINFYQLRWISDINNFENQVYSQNGEDGVLEFIFENIGTTNKIYVELGTEDAKECNTRYLRYKTSN